MTKVCTMAEAISRFVPDGAAVAMGCGGIGLRGGGPARIISTLGIFSPDEESGELVLTAIARFDPEGRWTGP